MPNNFTAKSYNLSINRAKAVNNPQQKATKKQFSITFLRLIQTHIKPRRVAHHPALFPVAQNFRNKPLRPVPTTKNYLTAAATKASVGRHHEPGPHLQRTLGPTAPDP